MKFSHSLQFNAVPEWLNKYIAYPTLKKLIYTLQRDEAAARASPDDDLERALLVLNDNLRPEPVRVFTAALDLELVKMDAFYSEKEKQLFAVSDALVADVEEFMQQVNDGSMHMLALLQVRRVSSGGDDDSDDDAVLPTATREPAQPLASQSVQAATSRRASDGAESRFAMLPSEGTPVERYFPDGAVAAGGDARPDPVRRRLVGDLVAQRLRLGSDPYDDPVFDPFLILADQRITLKKRLVAVYTSLAELKLFVELNLTGFTKALKKFDKLLHTKTKAQYLELLATLDKLHMFVASTKAELERHIDEVVGVYAQLTTGDLERARTELTLHLREQVVWERNTIWRDMIGMERKTQAAGFTASRSRANGGEATLDKPVLLEETYWRVLGVPIPRMLGSSRALSVYGIAAATLVVLAVQPFEDRAQSNCLAIVVCALLLWATETIPLFVTSLLVPLLIVMLGVLKDEADGVMGAGDAAKFIFSTMWLGVIMLLLGGFTLAAALSKFNIAKLVLTWILSKAGTEPLVVLFTIMGVALFASMWVLNVAAPVLCFLIVQPLLRTLPRGLTFANALILGIALASNIGGMALPIALPQNIVAIGYMDPPPLWGQWFVVALPVCVCLLVAVWGFLLLTFRQPPGMRLVVIRTIDDRFSGVQWYVTLVTAATILLWCLALRLLAVFGDMGVIAIFPLLAFFGPGLLTTEDFNNYPWNIVVLAMGGTALGKAVLLSGLLHHIAGGIQLLVLLYSIYGVMLTFGALILTVATFVLHTVAALIMVPLVKEVGDAMVDDPHPRLLIMASAMLCSAAMGLPTSGFPNVTAICMVDEVGKPYLTVKTFITRGVPALVICYLVIVTVGFALLKLINF